MSALAHAATAWRRAVGEHEAQDTPRSTTPIRCCTDHRPRGELYSSPLWRDRQPVVLVQFTARRLWLELPPGKTLLVQGSLCRISLAAPALGAARTHVKVLEIIGGSHSTLLQLRMLHPNRRMLRLLSQYALRHSAAVELTPLALRHRHFGAIDASPCMHFGTLTAPDEMAAVKQLRYRVFKESALLKPCQKHPDDTEDARDARSHIILGHWRNKLVASCRAYPMGPYDAYEFEAWTDSIEGLPPKEQCVELGRAAIALPFRNAGIPLTLLRMLTAYTMQSRRRYMVLCTTPALVPFYRYFGFDLTRVRFTFPGPHSFVGSVLVADLHGLWRGDRGNPLIWYALFGSLPQRYSTGFYAPQNLHERLRLQLLRQLGPVSQVARQWLTLRSRLRHLLGR